VPKWDVVVTIEEFGPNHRLWKKFAERANALTDTTLRWELAQSTDFGDITVGLRATVEAETPESAIRRVIRRVRDIGQRIDRDDQVRWGSISGTATRRAN
jgi:hypothetical protein